MTSNRGACRNDMLVNGKLIVSKILTKKLFVSRIVISQGCILTLKKDVIIIPNLKRELTFTSGIVGTKTW